MAVGLHPTKFTNPLLRWVDQRLPIASMIYEEYAVFPAPRNFNYLWNFGALALVMLVTMIASGVFLAMFYTPQITMAFDSVEHIRRDVNYGWLIQYIHIFRGVYYGSYKSPREVLWIFGVIIYLLMMATGFMGYTLPWSQMSYWGATVITNLFSAIPLVGKAVTTWLWGGFSVDNPTLNRFFALHYLLPFVIAAVVFLHVWALHIAGSNNPLGIEPTSEKDTVSFHPYYTVKDSFGMVVFLILYAFFIFYAPVYLGHPDHFVKADPLVTPAHIVPEWYFLPFYAMLRSVPSKLGGVIVMGSAILILLALPWLDRSKVRSGRFRPMFQWFFWFLVIDCILLGYVGANPPEGTWVLLGQIGTVYYFLHFLVVLPILLPMIEKPVKLPASIAEAVLGPQAAPLGGGRLAGAGAMSAPASEG